MDTQSTPLPVTTKESQERKTEKDLDNKKIVCQGCSCLILREKTAKLINKEIQLPVISKQDAKTVESLVRHLLVEDIYTFENMGFSNTVNTTKYLVCAVCEYGPIGYMDIKDKKSFVSLDRVHEKDD